MALNDSLITFFISTINIINAIQLIFALSLPRLTSVRYLTLKKF